MLLSSILCSLTISILPGALPPAPQGDPAGEDLTLALADTLDDFHRAAAEADGERYFDHFTEDAIFLGTDATERWDLAAFHAFADPYFTAGQGWAYAATERHLQLAPGGGVAWFDERLQNEKYGELRGSGVLREVGERWKIAQYNLSYPVPNELAGGLVERIAEQFPQGEPQGIAHFAVDGARRIALWEKVVPELLELPVAERPAVVLLPSATFCARATWDFSLRDYSVMDALARRGFDVYAVDPGGYGLSTSPDAGSAGGAIQAAGDLLVALDYLRELRGVQRVALVGPSWGGQVAGNFAMRNPDRVRGLVLYGFTWQRRLSEEAVSEAFDPGVFQRPKTSLDPDLVLAEFGRGVHEEDVPEAFLAQLLEHGKSVPTGALRDYVRELPLVDPGGIKTPCLMLYGRLEFELPAGEGSDLPLLDEERRADARAFYIGLRAPRHWIELPGAGHSAHLDRPHGLFQRCLAGWLERLPD